jgi:hypothetical protein
VHHNHQLANGNQWETPTEETDAGHLSNKRSLWKIKQPRNQLPFRRVTKISLINFKGIYSWVPEKRNKPPSAASNFLLFWNPTNPSKGQASFKPT